MTILVNLFGGPGCGKSTTAAGVFSLLKIHNVNCELVTEYAKDLTWEKRYKTLGNQYYVWGKQHHRLWRIKEEVDVIVTDSPTILGLIYGKNTHESFANLVLASFNEFENMNYLLKRLKIYEPEGRNQTENESKSIDIKVIKLLLKYGIKYNIIPGTYIGINMITKNVLNRLERNMEFAMFDFIKKGEAA